MSLIKRREKKLWLKNIRIERETASFDPFVGNITFARPHLVKKEIRRHHSTHSTPHHRPQPQ